MIVWLAIAYVWIVGIRDFFLTRCLINTADLSMEANPFARLAVERFGADALLAWKIAGLMTYTFCVLVVHIRSKPAANKVAAVGTIVSMILLFWWDFVLVTLATRAT